jgi:hypothetical protein
MITSKKKKVLVTVLLAISCLITIVLINIKTIGIYWLIFNSYIDRSPAVFYRLEKIMNLSENNFDSHNLNISSISFCESDKMIDEIKTDERKDVYIEHKNGRTKSTKQLRSCRIIDRSITDINQLDKTLTCSYDNIGNLSQTV